VTLHLCSGFSSAVASICMSVSCGFSSFSILVLLLMSAASGKFADYYDSIISREDVAFLWMLRNRRLERWAAMGIFVETFISLKKLRKVAMIMANRK
jgi:hypothetical protein